MCIRDSCLLFVSRSILLDLLHFSSSDGHSESGAVVPLLLHQVDESFFIELSWGTLQLILQELVFLLASLLQVSYCLVLLLILSLRVLQDIYTTIKTIKPYSNSYQLQHRGDR